MALATVGLLLVSGPVARAQSGDDSSWTDDNSAPPTDAQQPADVTSNASVASSASTQYSNTDPGALSDFRSTLDRYGSWVQDPTYGLVWVPSAHYVGSNFAPYVTSGHWGLTSASNWIWVSGYPFGWVVFHYGRWVWIGGTGWSWIAGRRYADAWVDWRVPDDGYDYIGWAPMPPSWGWYDGVAVSLWFGPSVPYVFCPSDYAFSPDVYRYIVHDRSVIDRAAHHSSRWAVPRGGRRGPSPRRAHVPANAMPSHHVAANPRAVAASRPSPLRIQGSRGPSRVRPVSSYRAAPRRLDRPRTLTGRHVSGMSRTLHGATVTRPQRVSLPQRIGRSQRIIRPHGVIRSHGVIRPQMVPSRSLRSERPAPIRLSTPRAPIREYRPYRRAPSSIFHSYRRAPSSSHSSYRLAPSRAWHYSRSYTPYRSSSSHSTLTYHPSRASSYTFQRSAPVFHRSMPSFHSFSPRSMHFTPAMRGGFHGRR